MASNYLLLAVISVIYVFIGEVSCDPPYDYQEGVLGTYDVVFYDCTCDHRGTSTILIGRNLNFTLTNKGSVFNYIQVINRKPVNQQGTIQKTGGGYNYGFVSFYMLSQESHGFLFQFKLYGKPAPGKSERAVTGNCPLCK